MGNTEKLIPCRGIQSSEEVTIKEIGILEILKYGMLPSCDKDIGDITIKTIYY